MMDLAWDVIRRYPGGRVVLLTGSEHKHYFDRDIAARENATIVEMEDLLPLDERPMEPAIGAFLEEGDDLLYYESGYPVDTNLYYQNTLVNLIHGPDMDWRPDIISARNVEIAGKVLVRWRASQPVSHRMTFDEAWYQFLSGDCEAAIEQLTDLAVAIEHEQIEDQFIRAYTYRNLGLCYDLLGERQDALRSYVRARTLMRGTRMERNADRVLGDYETVPYRRGRTAQFSQR
jgi:hypothetical protein